MNISVATATFYHLPFEQTLDIIAEAGFEYIELDLFWQNGKWSMAQHLREMEAKDVIRLVNQAGLHVSSIHDGGGIVDDANSIQGFMNPLLGSYLDELGYAPGCIVFHTPHIHGDYDDRWWQSVSSDIVEAVGKLKTSQTAVTIENMPDLVDCYLPLVTPNDLMEFVRDTELDVTLDVTHCPQSGQDPVEAASVLKEKVKSLHLSDFLDGNAHVFLGDGSLDFVNVFRALDLSTVRSMTIECAIARPGDDGSELSQNDMVERLRIAKSRLESWLAEVV
jgi:sugar phosphate isomerase/epimerase